MDIQRNMNSSLLVKDFLEAESMQLITQNDLLKRKFEPFRILSYPDSSFAANISNFNEIAKRRQSPNPMNDHSSIAAFLDSSEPEMISIGNIDLRLVKFHPLRSIGYYDDLIEKYTALLAVSGFMEQYPIIFGNSWQIIDGYHRLHAARVLNIPIHAIFINI